MRGSATTGRQLALRVVARASSTPDGRPVGSDCGSIRKQERFHAAAWEIVEAYTLAFGADEALETPVRRLTSTMHGTVRAAHPSELLRIGGISSSMS